MTAEAAVVITGNNKLPRKKASVVRSVRQPKAAIKKLAVHIQLPRSVKRLLNLAAAANDIKRGEVLDALATQIGDDGTFRCPLVKPAQTDIVTVYYGISPEVRKRVNLARAANDLNRTEVLSVLSTQISDDGRFRFKWSGK